MEDRWEFLTRWCSSLQGRVQYKKVEQQSVLWAEHKFRVEVDLHKRYETSNYWQRFAFNDDDEAAFKLQMQKVREAIALLVAVARVDLAAWKWLLREKCQNKKTKDNETLGLDLVLFFDTLHQTEPTAAYTRALANIAKLDSSLKAREPGVDIEIPVRVLFKQSDDGRKESDRLLNICKAEKAILERWNDIETEPVKSKSFRCTFVLQPMVAIFDNGNSAKFVKTIGILLANNVWFSQLKLFPVETKATAEMKLLSQLLSLVFGGLSRQQSQPPYRLLSSGNTDGVNLHQLQDVSLICDTAGSWEFGAILSSLVLNRMTKNVSVRLDCVDSEDDNISRNKWLWLAYGAFSKRARAIDSLTLTDVDCMTAEDIEAFGSVVESDHPEEVLCECPHGRVNERVATLVSGAKVRWELDAQGQPRRKSRALTLSSEMKNVWVLSDDGDDELVNAVVPGFGHCLVERCDLTFCEPTSEQLSENRPSSLTIQFKEREDEDENEDDDDENDGERETPVNNSGLITFIEKIGSSLKNLTLDGPRTDVDENVILRCCPKLETLSLCVGFVAVQLDFKQYRALRRQIPELNSHWDDVTAFTADLSDHLNPIAKFTRRLRLTLNKQWSPPDFEANAREEYETGVSGGDWANRTRGLRR